MKNIPFLKKGDCVSLISPAKAIESEKVLYAKKFWEEQGFKVKIGIYAFEKNFYFAGNIENRAKDFNDAINDDEVKAIVCNRGGYGSVSILNLIDWKSFFYKPKWIIGFSDITVFHLFLQYKNFPSIHATMPLNYEENTRLALKSLINCITGKNLMYKIKSSKYNIYGSCKGVAIGGNLSIIYSLLFMFSLDFFKNKILVIEDVGEHLYQIDRMFYSLKFKGVFDELNGVIVGGLTNLKDTKPSFGKKIEEIIYEHINPYKIPLSFNFPFGHINNNCSLILGNEISLDVSSVGSVILMENRL